MLIAGLIFSFLWQVLPSQTTIAWSQVGRDLKHQLEVNDHIHLVITDYQPVEREDYGAIIKQEEIWVQRPNLMRIEQTWQTALSPDYIRCVPTTTIYNEAGLYILVHDTRHWGFRDGDLLDVKRKVPYHRSIQKEINYNLMAKYYAKYDWSDGSYTSPMGKEVRRTALNRERVTVYDFAEYEGVVHRCWLRDTDHRLLRMEVFRTQHDGPVIKYDVFYDAPPNPSLFEPVIPDDYTNGQTLGYEGQPMLINPEVATVVLEGSSARFYRVESQSGRSQPEVEAAIAKSKPAIEVRVDSQRKTLSIDLFPGHDSSEAEPCTWKTIGFGSVGERRYGVLQRLAQGGQNRQKLRLIPAREYAGQGQIILECIFYKTDYGYCKIAFDADGDGQMDAWCQVPSEETVSMWRQALMKK